ncbi:histidine phosphatase family protein, partial [Candidatus Woesearchaeota archaeon]|nr:histidine phosphatase family protein [Candidatus Woesearchaeota archaeon]
LNARGTNAAIELSDFLAPTPIDIVMASELKRSYQFAEPTAIRFGIPVLKEPMLNERYWGSVQGRHYSKINTGGLTLENFLYFTNDVICLKLSFGRNDIGWKRPYFLQACTRGPY